MPFIPAPFHFRVRAKIEGTNVVFPGLTVVLLKYLREEEEKSSRGCGDDEGPEPSPRRLKIKTIATGDGSTKLDPRWWTIRDVGSAGPVRPGFAAARLARLEFNGGDFSGQFPDLPSRLKDAANLALYDAFLEQGTIRFQVETGDKVVSTLVLKVSYF